MSWFKHWPRTRFEPAPRIPPMFAPPDHELANSARGVKVMGDRWIPVAEALPEFGVRVLVMSKRFVTIDRVESINKDGVRWENYSTITHWQPLPDPLPEEKKP